jgi:hypothetical protein
MHWQFSDDSLPSLIPKESLPYKLMLHQGNATQPTEIQQKDCSEAHKTLGVMKAPNRSQRSELKNKCNAHAVDILTNSVSHTDAALAYIVYHLTSIGYSLGTTYITKQAFTSIQGKRISAFLATSGYNQHFPRALAFVPRSHGGLEYMHLYLLQGQQCTKLLRRHTLHNTEIGKQICVDIAWIQLEAGTSTPVLQKQSALDYVQDGWVLGIRQFLQTVNAEIKFTNTEPPKLYRQGDEYLMDHFRQQGYNMPDLCCLNRCRIYLQVARTSDITTIAGTHIYAHILGLEREKQTEGDYTMYPSSRLSYKHAPA